MKTYEFEDGRVVLADNAVDYFNSIKMNLEEVKKWKDTGLDTGFRNLVKQTYQEAKKELDNNEKMVLDRILIANDINPKNF